MYGTYRHLGDASRSLALTSYNGQSVAVVVAGSLALGVAVFLYLGWEQRQGGDWRWRALWRFGLFVALLLVALAWLT